MKIKNLLILFFVLGSFFTFGCFLGDYYAPKNWQNGFTDGYRHCEIDFLIEKGVVLDHRGRN